jgi:predicted Zn-dependent protease
LSPADPVAHLYLGEAAFAENRAQQAIDHYNRSNDLHWKDPQVTIHYAKCALQVKQPKLAEDALEHLGSATPSFQFEAGVLLAAAKRYAAAATHFAAAQDGYPDPYEVGFNLTLMHVEAQNYPAAIIAGEKLTETYRKAELYNLLARAYEGGGSTQQAYDALRTATQIDPNDETNYLDLMSLCLAHENWDLSLEISDIALTHTPNSYRVHLERGAVLAMKGRVEDAEKEFVEATRLDPKTSLPLVALAIIQIELKKPAEAAAALRARRKQDAKDYLVDWFLAEALVQMGADPGTANEKEAVMALEDAVRSNSAAVSPRVLLGKLLAKRGDFAGATTQFEAALKLDSGNVSAAYQLATIYRKAGKTQRATELMTLVGKATSVPDTALSPRREIVRIVREGAK